MVIIHPSPETTDAISLEAFEAFVALPENANKRFELVNGEIIEVPSNPFASDISSIINYYVRDYVIHHRIGFVTGEAGGYMVNGEPYAPDVAYISKIKQPKLARQGYNPNPPDLAVEVEYPTSAKSERSLRLKLFNYLAVGTLVWVVYPETRQIEVYAPGGEPVKILGINDTLDGGAVLPGFTLALSQIFTEE